MEIALFRQLDKKVKTIFLNYYIDIQNTICSYGVFTIIPQQKEVDFSPYWFQPNADLIDHIDLDFYVYSSEIVLLQRWPAEETRLKALIRPFSPTVSAFCDQINTPRFKTNEN